jgi:dipeptidase E
MIAFLNWHSIFLGMTKFYLLGGENTLRRDAKDVNQAAFNDAGESPSVLVFSWARASFDETYPKRKLVFDYFRSLGARTVNVVDFSRSYEEIKARISECDLVYLTGGVPSVLVERLRSLHVDELLNSFEGVVIGRSAGALVLCRKFIVTYRSDSSVKLMDGFGLVDITLKAHFKVGKDDFLFELSKKEPIYAVPKGSAIVADNGKLSFINTVYLFEDGKRQVVSRPV